jgi:hypothetical protein
MTAAHSSLDLIIEPPCSAPDGRIEYGCRLESGGGSQRIWFRFPAAAARAITLRADPFVIATALHAAGRFSHVRIHGAVSDGLLANLADFHGAYAAFHRRPAPALRYTAMQQAGPASHPAAPVGLTAFSGGVDSCFTVFRHTSLSPLGPKRPLGAALMMHGFDIPLDQPDVFARSADRSRRLTDDAGLELLIGATNLRILPVPWEDCFSTAVAASLSFFQPRYAYGLVPSFQDWTHVHFDHGSNPLTDPLLSSLAFAVVHDGTGFGRIEKLRALTGWPAALRHLRVCWQGAELDRNCCRCEKCLRTMLMLRLCGVKECEAFPEPLDVRHLDSLVIKNQSGLDEFAYLLAEARRLGLNEPWIEPTRRAWRRNRRQRALRRRGRALAELLPPSLQRVLWRGRQRWHAAPAALVPARTP